MQNFFIQHTYALRHSGFILLFGFMTYEVVHHMCKAKYLQTEEACELPKKKCNVDDPIIITTEPHNILHATLVFLFFFKLVINL